METSATDLESTSSRIMTLLIIIKSVSIVLLFIISVLLGILPAKLPAFSSNAKLLAFINSFSAGLFLGLAMMHLLAESLIDYNNYYLLKGYTGQTFPIPFAVCILSFSFVLFLERIVFQAHNFLHLHAENHDHEDHSVKKIGSHHTSEIDDLHEALVIPIDSPELFCNREKEEETFKKLISTKEKLARTSIDIEFHKSAYEKKNVRNTSEGLVSLRKNSDTLSVMSSGHNHAVGPYAILTALSIHGMFEGVAVGIQNNPAKALNLVIAVLLHKWAEALTLGVALYKGKLTYKTIVLQICIFSAAGPLGIVIGWAISTSSLLIAAIFKALSAGTFLYVAATELVVEEFSISTNMYSKFSVFLLGLIFMGGIVWFE